MFKNYQHTNNAVATLMTPLAVGDKIITLQGKYNLFPTSNFIVKVSKIDGEKVVARENIFVAQRNDNICVGIKRAYEEVPINDDATEQTRQAMSFDSGDVVEVTMSSEVIKNIQEGIENSVQKHRGLRTGLSTSETFIVSNGEEKIANILTTDIEDTDKFQLITENGNARNITFAEIKNKVNREYVTEIELAEATPELTSESFSEQFLPNITTLYNVEESRSSHGINNLLKNSGYTYGPNTINNLAFSVKIKIAEPIKLTKIDFEVRAGVEYSGEGLFTVYVNGREVHGEATIGSGSRKKVSITNIPDEYVSDITFKMISLTGQSLEFQIYNGLKFTGSKHRNAYYAISKAKKLEIKQNLPEEKSSTSVIKNGVAFRFPFDIKVTKIRTKSLASSNSAQVSILDGDSRAILASANTERGRQDFFFDYTLKANKEYFFVVDNSDNFGRKIGYQGDYRDKNPFFTGEVTNGSKGSNSKFWAFESIELDGQNKGYLSRSGFLDNFAGFAQAGKNIGEIIQIKDTENSYAHGFTGLVEGSSYYISPIAGLITSAAVLAGSHKKHIGVAITPTTLRLTSHE